jgi:peptidoglycan biosynthesis protein MviN/MurJ (putative lipid II flippase)
VEAVTRRGLLPRVRGSRQLQALLATVAGSAPGLVLPFALTWRFGAGRITDAYFFGFAIAAFVTTLAVTVLEANVLPAAHATKLAGGDPLRAFARRLSRQAMAVVFVSYVPFVLLGCGLLLARHSWSAEQRLAAAEVMVVCVAYLCALARSSVNAGVLYALGDFVSPPLTICVRSVVGLALIPLLPLRFGSVVLLMGGVAFGEILRSVALGVRVRRLSRALVAVPATDRPSPPPPVWATARPHALSLLAITAAPVVDRMVASSLRPGAVTLIDIAEKLYYVPLTVLISSFTLVAGARWAENGGGDVGALRADVSQAIRRGVVLAAIGGGLVFVAVCAVTLAAGATLAGVPSRSLRELVGLLLLGLPAATVLSLAARLLTSTRHGSVLPLLGMIDFAANVALDLAGAQLFGVNGIALASTIVRALDAALFIVVVRRLLHAGTQTGARRARARWLSAQR